jgi:hypothetical protein
MNTEDQRAALLYRRARDLRRRTGTPRAAKAGRLLDLKNPRAKEADHRRPVEIIEGAVAKQRELLAVLDELRALVGAFDKITSDSPRAKLGDVAPLVRRQVKIDPEKTYTEIGVRSFYKGIFHRRTIPGAEFTWQKLFRIATGDLVFSNLMAWEQAIALASAADDGCVGNHRMLTCEADRTRCLPMFLWYYFRTPEGFGRLSRRRRDRSHEIRRCQPNSCPISPFRSDRWTRRSGLKPFMRKLMQSNLVKPRLIGR